MGILSWLKNLCGGNKVIVQPLPKVNAPESKPGDPPSNSQPITTNPLILVDVSHHNVDSYGPIDFAGLKRNGVVGVICKASEGAFTQDDTMMENVQLAQSAGLLTGIYHFFRANVLPQGQANNFNAKIAALKKAGISLSLPNTVDAETTDGVSAQALRDGVSQFMDLVDGEEILYTGDSFFQENAFSKITKPFIRWIARYSPTKPSTPDTKMWQYTETGTFPGVKGKFDINYFYGTMEELKALRK